MSLNAEQVELLLQVARNAKLIDEQISSLKADNPFKFSGEVSERVQIEIGRLNATQARVWAQGAGQSLSLRAAAARHGLIEGDLKTAIELERLTPQVRSAERSGSSG